MLTLIDQPYWTVWNRLCSILSSWLTLLLKYSYVSQKCTIYLQEHTVCAREDGSTYMIEETADDSLSQMELKNYDQQNWRSTQPAIIWQTSYANREAVKMAPPVTTQTALMLWLCLSKQLPCNDIDKARREGNLKTWSQRPESERHSVRMNVRSTKEDFYFTVLNLVNFYTT